jgi:hypothetical protein
MKILMSHLRKQVIRPYRINETTYLANIERRNFKDWSSRRFDEHNWNKIVSRWWNQGKQGLRGERWVSKYGDIRVDNDTIDW